VGKNLVFATMTIALGLAIGLAFSEGVLRLLGYDKEIVYQPNPLFGWSHTPNDSFEWSKQNLRVRVTTNSKALRDYEYAYKKPDGVFRVLVLGDSFAEALQVPLQSSFPKKIEDSLNRKRPIGHKKVQVINSGTSGYGTDNELLFFRHEGSKYSPDLVLLAFCVCNDVRNNWYELENLDAGGFRKPYFVFGVDGLEIRNYPFEKPHNLLIKLKLFLNRRMRLYTFLRETRDKLRHKETVAGEGMPLDLNVYSTDYTSAWQKAWAVTEAIIVELNKEVKDQDAKLAIVIVPTELQVYPQRWREQVQKYANAQAREWNLDKPNQRLISFLKREGIEFIDLLPAFRKQAGLSGKQFYIPNDGHWNAEGHRLAAQVISSVLLEKGLIVTPD
jgi:hypothetical protein